MIAADENLAHCDVHFDQFDDGEILAMLWTFRVDDEETIEVFTSRSFDDGLSWSTPEQLAFTGQIAYPCVLGGDNVVCAVNVRTGQQGIRLLFSGDRGRTWDLRPSVQMWDAATTSVLATAIDSVAEEAQLAASQDARARASETERAVWDALPLFTFGSCRLNKVAGNDQQYYELLLTYYAEDATTKMAAVHCCRFAVSM
jgi:hypothetical protein